MNEVKFKANINDVKNAAGLPAPAAADAGKVLTVGEAGGWELGSGGGGGLPAIESGDAGKVLTVNAGETGAEWAAASGVIIANYIFDEQTHTVSCDMTYDEIVSHLTNGELVVGNIMGNFIIPLYSPQEYTLIYVQNRIYVTTQQGDLTITMNRAQISHVHTPNQSELIDVTNDAVYWPVTRLQQ